jgi:uncharacterized membrane protein
VALLVAVVLIINHVVYPALGFWHGFLLALAFMLVGCGVGWLRRRAEARRKGQGTALHDGH